MTWKRSNKKAFSLLEVMIMLVIISVTVIAAMNIVARVNVSIKNNEILDVVNDTLLQSLELLKSPSDVFMSADGVSILSSTTNYQYFSIKDVGPSKYLQLNTTNAGAPFDDCTTSSTYYVPVVINGAEKNYLICMQFQIRRQVSGTNTYYQTLINVIYYLEGEKFTDTLSTYRYGEFTAL